MYNENEVVTCVSCSPEKPGTFVIKRSMSHIPRDNFISARYPMSEISIQVHGTKSHQQSGTCKINILSVSELDPNITKNGVEILFKFWSYKHKVPVLYNFIVFRTQSKLDNRKT